MGRGPAAASTRQGRHAEASCPALALRGSFPSSRRQQLSSSPRPDGGRCGSEGAQETLYKSKERLKKVEKKKQNKKKDAVAAPACNSDEAVLPQQRHLHPK